MRAAEGPFLKTLDVAFNCSVNETCSWTKALTINQPAINVLIICHNETASSARPTDVEAIKVTEDEVLIVWKPLTSSCIETYIVEFSKNGSDDFKKISWVSFVFPSFYYRSSKLPGYVRIKAVDLHGRQSRYSKVVRVD
ncbi:hypothetical protein HDE_06639 [Halotydeus destructor]|nr:hypothetical protein HDE_06639 [Halotydeus destructor]